MGTVTVRSDLAGLQQRLRAAASTAPAELNAAALRAMTGLPDRLRGSALSVLPRRGGLGALVAGSRFTTRPLTTGARSTVTSRHDIAAMDRGRLRHPLFGNRGHWYQQAITPGWWTTVVKSQRARAQTEMERALDNIARSI